MKSACTYVGLWDLTFYEFSKLLERIPKLLEIHVHPRLNFRRRCPYESLHGVRGRHTGVSPPHTEGNGKRSPTRLLGEGIETTFG